MIQAAAIVLLALAAPDLSLDLTIGSGKSSRRGSFDYTAHGIQAALERDHAPFKLSIRTTNGSCDNLIRLLRGELDLILAQYDIAAEVYQRMAVKSPGRATATIELPKKIRVCDEEVEVKIPGRLRLLTGISEQAIHWLVRYPVYLDSFDQAIDREVVIGRPGSGSFETARRILGAAGFFVDPSLVNQPDQQSGPLVVTGTRAASPFTDGSEVLFVLRTTAIGSGDIQQILKSYRANLNQLPERVLERLMDQTPYYRICEIPEGEYGVGLPKYAVPTACLSSALLTFEGSAVGDAEARWLVESVAHLHRETDFAYLAPRLIGLAEEEPIALHAGAQQLYDEISRDQWIRLALWLVIAVLVAFLVRRMLKATRRAEQLESQLSATLLSPMVPVSALLLLVVITTFAVWELERRSNSDLRRFADVFWVMNMYVTGNFDNETLKTSSAKTIGAVSTVLGLGVLAWFTAALTNLLGRDQKAGFWALRNHIVVFNFREDMMGLIRLLRSPGPSRHLPIHVTVNDRLPRRVRTQLNRVRGLYMHSLNPEVPENLRSLHLGRAKRVVVLDGRDADIERESDGRGFHPVRVIRAIQRAVQAESDHKAHQAVLDGKAIGMVEMRQGEPEELYEPYEGWLTALQPQKLSDLWITAAAAAPTLPAVLTDLLSFKDDNAEVYAAQPPRWAVDRPWRDLRRTLYGAQRTQGVVLLGIIRPHPTSLEPELLVNPALNTRLRPQDRLLALAENENELRRLLSASSGGLSLRARSIDEPATSSKGG